MTAIELLFRERRRSAQISYEEFIHAGWTHGEYMEYLHKCEVVRCAMILESESSHIVKDEYNSNTYLDTIRTITQKALDDLVAFISTYFVSDLHSFKYSAFFPYYKPCSLNNIFVDLEDFRFRFENKINIILNNDFAQLFGDDLSKLGEKQISNFIQIYKEKINENSLPPEPDYNIYSSIQNFAKKEEEYYDTELLEDHIEVLEEELHRRNRIFDQNVDILHIYAGSKICKNQHNEFVEPVTATILGLYDKKIRLNVNYCPKCDLFFIKKSLYDRYIKQFSVLPIMMVYEGESNGKYSFANRQEYSRLRLAGYNVGQNNGLKDKDRQWLLYTLIIKNVVSKTEAINHIDMLINFNQDNPRYDRACSKWEMDLKFIQNINIDKQKQVGINEIVAGK